MIVEDYLRQLFPPSSTRAPTALELLEHRRQRGLDEVRELEALRVLRPLHGFEQRWLRRSASLVREMDEEIRALKVELRG